MKITVKKETLLASMIFQAKNDIRYYLNGIFFGAGPEKPTCSTDGHRLFVGHHENEIDKDVIISIIGPRFTAFDYAEIDTESELITYHDEIGSKVGVAIIKLIDGRFPDYKRVLPTQTAPVSEIGFNAQYLSDIEKAAKIFDKRWQGIKIITNGSTGSAVVEIRNPTQTAKVVVMPMRI